MVKKHKVDELELLEQEYERLARELQVHRQEYYKLQDIYADDADTLAPKLQKVSAYLHIIKSDIISVQTRIQEIKEDRAKKIKNKRRWFSLKVS